MNKDIRKDFDWFINNPDMCYLDSSATSLKPNIVIKSEMDYYNKLCCNPHNKDSIFAYQVSSLIDNARTIVANLIEANKNEIIFTSGATESINLIAQGLAQYLKQGDEIILTFVEHSSNILPWQNLAQKIGLKLVWVGSKNNIPTEKDIFDAITPKTKVITFCDVSNIIGHYIDMNLVAKKAKKKNNEIIISIDATQSIPHLKHDVSENNIDFLQFSAHKMLGPTGVGVCYINKRWSEKINSTKLGGGMNGTIEEKSFEYSSSPSKFEGGTPNVAGIIGFGAAINYLNSYGWNNLRKHEAELKKYINKRLKEIKNIEFYSSSSQFPIVFFNIKGCSPQDLANYLGHNNIIVRSGLSCAKLANRVLTTEAAVRASFYIYNTKIDVDKLISVLKNYKKGSELDNVIL